MRKLESNSDAEHTAAENRDPIACHSSAISLFIRKSERSGWARQHGDCRVSIF
jgi:hypothetical protein